MEDNVSESEKPIPETNDDVIQYIECTRLVEGGNLRRFETIVAKFDVVQHEFDYQVAKSLLFFAIEHNDEIFVKTLLDMEIPYEKSYPVGEKIRFSTENEFINVDFVSNFFSGRTSNKFWTKQFNHFEIFQCL